MNEQVASLYANIGVKITSAIRGLRDFRSRLVQSQSGLKTLRDQSKITSAAISIGFTAALVALGTKGVGALADIGVSMAVFQLATRATTGEMELARAKIAELAHDASLPKATLEASAAALAELGKAGLSAHDAIDALRPTMLLAAVGGLEASDAALMLAGALQAFHLPGTEAARIADLLAGAELRAGGSVKDHADALKQAGAVFALAGVPIEDLVTLIAELADNTIIGSDAGTALRTMMLHLIAPTDEAAAMLRAMGISVYDATGKVKPFREIIKQFTEGLAPLTDAQKNQRLETIFGTDAIRAAAIIFGGKGVEAFDKTKAAITEVGLAQQLATAKTAGLGGALENVAKAANTATVDAIKPFEQTITDLALALSAAILWFDALDPSVKNWIVGILAGVAALLAIIGTVAVVIKIVGTLITWVSAVAGWLGFLGGAVEVLGAALTFLTMTPLGLLILTLALLAAGLIWAYKNSETFRQTVDGAFRGIATAAQAMWSVIGPIFEKISGVLRDAIGGVGDLARSWGLLPKSAAAMPTVNGSQPNVAPIPSQWQTPGFTGFPSGGISLVPGRAGGGSVAGGSSYLVGERGPELFTPGRSGVVTANGAGGAQINANFYGPVFGFSDLKDLVVRAMNEAKLEGRV